MNKPSTKDIQEAIEHYHNMQNGGMPSDLFVDKHAETIQYALNQLLESEWMPISEYNEGLGYVEIIASDFVDTHEIYVGNHLCSEYPFGEREDVFYRPILNLPPKTEQKENT